MAKFFYYLLFFITSLGLVLGVRDTYVDIAVKKRGEIIRAKIEKVNCHPRNGNLDLTYLNQSHFILIAYADCLKGKYQIGDSITVRALPEYRRTQLPNANTYGGIFAVIFIAILLFLWILARKEIMQYLSGKGNSKSG